MTRLALLFLFAAWLAGCDSPFPRGPVDDTVLRGQLGFLQGEAVDRSLVVARLGAPAAVFEGGRLSLYRVYERAGRLTQEPVAASRCFSLVIEYLDSGRLRRHALVRVACEAWREGAPK